MDFLFSTSFCPNEFLIIFYFFLTFFLILSAYHAYKAYIKKPKQCLECSTIYLEKITSNMSLHKVNDGQEK